MIFFRSFFTDGLTSEGKRIKKMLDKHFKILTTRHENADESYKALIYLYSLAGMLGDVSPIIIDKHDKNKLIKNAKKKIGKIKMEIVNGKQKNDLIIKPIFFLQQLIYLLANEDSKIDDYNRLINIYGRKDNIYHFVKMTLDKLKSDNFNIELFNFDNSLKL